MCHYLLASAKINIKRKYYKYFLPFLNFFAFHLANSPYLRNLS